MTVIAKNNNSLTVKSGFQKYLIYTDELYDIGDVLIIKGNFLDIDENHVPLLFNYQKYCRYQRIYGRITNPEIIKIKNVFTISKIQNFTCNYCDKYFSSISSSYLKALVIGNKISLEKEMLNSINSLGISHLFVVSGLHVVLLAGMLEWIIKKIFKKSVSLITIIILIIYTFITNMAVSVIRVVLAYLLKQSNEKYSLSLTSLDQLSIITIFILLVNPYYLFNSSFILSFGLTYSLVIGSKLLNNKKYFLSLLYMSLYCQIIGLPFSYNFSNEFNITSVLFNMVFVPFVSYIFLPVSLIVIFIPFLNMPYEYLIKIFEYMIKICDRISIYINFPQINIFFLCIFFIIIYYLFKLIEEHKFKKSLFVVLLIYMLVWVNYIKLDIFDQVIFFDLPNGESTLIHGSFNKYNIMIDTGDIEENNTIVEYLKKRGIRKLDYVIITHSDSDHIGGLEKIMMEVKVKNVITNIYEKRDIFEYYYRYNQKLKLYYLKKGDYFKYQNLSFRIYSPSTNLGDVNNNSLVFLADIDGLKILFTGDIEALGEKTLEIDKVIECNLLKIAHHGSKTSTTPTFLRKVSYEVAIIMNGYHNIFDFPSPTVINRIKDKPYYVTGYEKTIIYQKLFFKKYFRKI
ncbi:MAG: DNA internalization-related competence protein ComEC/Rec2 [Bacilli bacterium]|nr:DNA internalization-related competence protein ComEC/Rec2 [Bacilli bacterium]